MIQSSTRDGEPNVFVWVFHRVSGVALIFLIGFQLFTGFFQASAASSESIRIMAGLHKHAAVNCLAVFFFLFHALYGVRTILLDLGLRREKRWFWVCTVSGCILYAVFLVLFLTLVRA